MYAVSDAFKAAIYNSYVNDRLAGVITLADGTQLPFGDGDLLSDTLVIDNQCVNGDELEFGAVYAGQLSMTITTNINRYRLLHATVAASYFLALPDGTEEEVPLGVYTVTEANRKGDTVALKALDNMVRLNTGWDKTGVYGDVFELLTWCCAQCELELANTREEIEALPNGTLSYQLDASFAGACPQHRDLVAVLAQTMGCFATADREGRIALRRMGGGVAGTLPADVRTSTEVSDFRVRYTDLTIHKTDGGSLTVGTIEGAPGLSMTIQDNPCFSAGTEDAQLGMAQALLDLLEGYNYTPANISAVENPAIECGDLLLVPVGGDEIAMLVQSYTWKYRGLMTLKSVGQNPYLTGVLSKEDKKFSHLDSSVASAESLVVSYQNLKAVKLTDALQNVIRLNFMTAKEANLLFNATLILDVAADEPAEVTFQYELNGERDAYHLPTQTVTTGKYTVTLFKPLMAVPGNSNNHLRVLAKTSGGTVTIAEYGIWAAVNGTGMIATGEEPWDGTITIEQEVPRMLSLGEGLALMPFADEAVCTAQVPASGSVSQAVPAFISLGGGLRVSGFTAEVGMDFVWTKMTIDVKHAPKCAYDHTLIDLSQGDYRLQQAFVQPLAAEPIDEGGLGVFAVDATKYMSIDSIEVS